MINVHSVFGANLIGLLLKGGRIVLVTESVADVPTLEAQTEDQRVKIVGVSSPDGYEILKEGCGEGPQIIEALTRRDEDPLDAMQNWVPNHNFEDSPRDPYIESRAEEMFWALENHAESAQSAEKGCPLLFMVSAHPRLLTVLARQLAEKLMTLETNQIAIEPFAMTDIRVISTNNNELVIERPAQPARAAA